MNYNICSNGVSQYMVSFCILIVRKAIKAMVYQKVRGRQGYGIPEILRMLSLDVLSPLSRNKHLINRLVQGSESCISMEIVLH